MVRNLRAESDRMHALACICRTALCVYLLAKENVRRGQKPLVGTDIASLFEDARIKDDLHSITSKSLFREELVAMLESCFQLSLPLPAQRSSGMESRVIGALAYGTGYGALNWTEPALEVVEVCRPCIKWDCDGRTYAIDCYLKLLVRLCYIYDTRGGVKRVKDGASQDQILNETRLQNLQRELVRDLREVHTPRISGRLLWAISEHINLEGLDPLLADDPDDPLNIILTNIRKVLCNTDSSPSTTNRLQDVQAVLLSAQLLGSRNARAGQLLPKELEEFRSHPSADSVNKHQCRLILQRMKYVSSHSDDKWAGISETRGDYPFSHHKLTVQFYASAAQDRKLRGLIHKAFWNSGDQIPIQWKDYLHLKVLNLTEIELNRVDIRVGLSGGLYFMDGSPQAVRQLHDVVSQEPVRCSVTVGVSHFERCALWVQVLYYPFHGSGAPEDYEGDYSEEDTQIMRQRRCSRPELGDPVIFRLECTGTYTYEGSGFKATAAQQYGESPFLSGLKSLSSKPFHKVCSHLIRTVAGFQLCYAAKTLFGGFLGMMIFGASEVSRNVDLGDETTTMICKFVVRASDASITKEIGSDLQAWMDDLTDGTIAYMPEDEVKEAAAERLRISMERIALLKAARPRKKSSTSDDDEEEKEEDEMKKDKEHKDYEEDGKGKGPSTLFK
ncbi:UNVERIFIED_CONTAM: protein TPLATE [Sesamum angustifolium]|uniref:Protein TPLATE n=1 Tax=Sesamum angustifolium TaxID=2727405 RepID=A0AAW2RNL6_9LAMI